jgi:hypothetical protein
MLALLLVAGSFGCSSAVTPFATSPLPASAGVVEAGPRVSICYNTFKTNTETLFQLARAECLDNAVAERVDTDYRLDDCPLLTPGRATFVCKPKPK